MTVKNADEQIYLSQSCYNLYVSFHISEMAYKMVIIINWEIKKLSPLRESEFLCKISRKIP